LEAGRRSARTRSSPLYRHRWPTTKFRSPPLLEVGMWVCVYASVCVRTGISAHTHARVCVCRCVCVCACMCILICICLRCYICACMCIWLRSTEDAQGRHNLSDTICTGVTHDLLNRLPCSKWVRALAAHTSIQSMPADSNYTNVSRQAHDFLRKMLASVAD
jgi:hypothetical protein